jgi:hypothetical protein
MKATDLIRFSFKSEAIWMLIFNLAPAVVGLLILFVAVLLR